MTPVVLRLIHVASDHADHLLHLGYLECRLHSIYRVIANVLDVTREAPLERFRVIGS